MLKSRLFEPINGLILIFRSWFFLWHNFSSHDVIMIAESSDLILNNFRSSILGTRIGNIDKLVLIEW